MDTHAQLVAIIEAYDRTWNGHDVDKILEFFTDDAVVEVEPAPPPPFAARSTGKAEVRRFVQGLVPGFYVESSNHRVVGGRVTWRAIVSCDAFRQLGLDQAVTACEAAIHDGRLSRFHIDFAPETVAKLQSSLASRTRRS
jgi:ABC-type amino acid transport substrate-binding protein